VQARGSRADPVGYWRTNVSGTLDACRPGHWTAYNVGSGRRTTIMDVEPAELLADASRIRRDLGWRPESSGLSRIVADAVAAATSRERSRAAPRRMGPDGERGTR
jgi:UDP-glucose 4-epimerase